MNQIVKDIIKDAEERLAGEKPFDHYFIEQFVKQLKKLDGLEDPPTKRTGREEELLKENDRLAKTKNIWRSYAQHLINVYRGEFKEGLETLKTMEEQLQEELKKVSENEKN